VSEKCQDIIAKMLEYRNDLRPKFTNLIVHQWFSPKIAAKIDQNLIERLRSYQPESGFKQIVRQFFVRSKENPHSKEQFLMLDSN